MNPLTDIITKFLTDLITTKTGSGDVVRCGMILAGASLIALSAYDVIGNGRPFDPIAFGGGMAAIFAGGGVGIAAKRKDEPEAPVESEVAQ